MRACCGRGEDPPGLGRHMHTGRCHGCPRSNLDACRPLTGKREGREKGEKGESLRGRVGSMQ